MIEDGLFERFPVKPSTPCTTGPAMPPGTVGINRGAMMAAADRITIEITGKGGHGAHAYLTVDPVLVAAHIITAVQSIVSRNVRPIDARRHQHLRHAGRRPGRHERDPRRGHAGRHRAHLQRARAGAGRARLNELCSGRGAGLRRHRHREVRAHLPGHHQHRPRGDVRGRRGRVAGGCPNVVRDMEPSMGAEDFSFMLQVKPGAYLRIGQGGERRCMLHNSRYDFNDEILPARRRAACQPGRAGHAAGRYPSRAARESITPYRGALMKGSNPRSVPMSFKKKVAAAAAVRPGAISLVAARRPCASPTRATRCRWTRTRSTSRCS
jgi:hypothetical protein